MKKTNLMTRVISFALALILTLTALPSVFSTTASAATSSAIASKLASYLPLVTTVSPLSGSSKVYAYVNKTSSSKTSSYYVEINEQVVVTGINSTGTRVCVKYWSTSGTYREKWFPFEEIVGVSTVSVKNYTAANKVTTYRMVSASKVSSYGSISKYDKTLGLGTRTIGGNKYTIMVYPISSTKLYGVSGIKYKMGLVLNSSSTSSAKVSLSVENYKQYDSRWGSTYIGNKTIKQVGCLLTSISEVYSYKTGTTVYPNTMKSKLTFSNNDLVWSSLTKVGLSRTAYNCKITNSMMSAIYTQLKAGHPVIIGAKTASGNQHWVVITGYAGTSTTILSTSNFTINDPNSTSCATLAQFLASYPTVVGLITY